jgi:hypothetical protein
MDCPECLRLKTRCEALERAYSVAVDELAARLGYTPAKDFSLLRRVADDARLAAEVSRLELEKHKRVHTSVNFKIFRILVVIAAGSIFRSALKKYPIKPQANQHAVDAKYPQRRP